MLSPDFLFPAGFLVFPRPILAIFYIAFYSDYSIVGLSNVSFWFTRSTSVGVLTACPHEDLAPLMDIIADRRRENEI